MSQQPKEATIIKLDRADEVPIVSNVDDLPCFITNIVFARYERDKRKAPPPPKGCPNPQYPKRNQPTKDEQFLDLLKRMGALLEDTRNEVDKTNERVDQLAKTLYRFANELVARGLIV